MDQKIKGGYSEKYSVWKIHDYLKVNGVDNNEQLRKGQEIELEHTSDWNIAQRIAMDHLLEIPDYYTRLEKMEKDALEYWKDKLIPIDKIKEVRKEQRKKTNILKRTNIKYFIEKYKPKFIAVDYFSIEDKLSDDGIINLDTGRKKKVENIVNEVEKIFKKGVDLYIHAISSKTHSLQTGILYLSVITDVKDETIVFPFLYKYLKYVDNFGPYDVFDMNNGQVPDDFEIETKKFDQKYLNEYKEERS